MDDQTLPDWVTTVCVAMDIDPRVVDIAAVLDLAKDAAHGIARPAAPLTTFLAGYLAGRQHGIATTDLAHPADPADRVDPGDEARAVLARLSALIPAASIPAPSTPDQHPG